MEYRYIIYPDKDCLLKTFRMTMEKQYNVKMTEKKMMDKLLKSLLDEFPTRLRNNRQMIVKKTRGLPYDKIAFLVSKEFGLKSKKMINTVSTFAMLSNDKCFDNKYVMQHLSSVFKVKLFIYSKGTPSKDSKIYGTKHNKVLFLKKDSVKSNKKYRMMIRDVVETINDDFFKELSNVRNLSNKKGKFDRFGLSSN